MLYQMLLEIILDGLLGQVATEQLIIPVLMRLLQMMPLPMSLPLELTETLLMITELEFLGRLVLRILSTLWRLALDGALQHWLVTLFCVLKLHQVEPLGLQVQLVRQLLILIRQMALVWDYCPMSVMLNQAHQLPGLKLIYPPPKLE